MNEWMNEWMKMEWFGQDDDAFPKNETPKPQNPKTPIYTNNIE